MSLEEFMKRLCKETILMARGGMLVDIDKAGVPYIVLYTAETIINWSDNSIILRELVYEDDPNDRFKKVAVEQYRELSLEGGAYTVTIWRKSKEPNTDQQEWVIFGTPTVPTSVGKPLTEIPFFWLNPLGRANSIERPPLLGMVNISISHYRSSADLEHGRHFTGLPTLYVTGATDEKAIHVGAEAAIVLSDPTAKVGYAEFTGQGLSSLERALDQKEAQMAALGAAVIQAAQRKGVEAAETARIRISGENSLLLGTVKAIEESLEAALRCASKWIGAPGDISIRLNRDFIAAFLPPQALQGLVSALQAGALSLESFLWSLQQADYIPGDKDLAEEKAMVEREAAARANRETALAVKVKSASGNTAAV